MVKIPFDDVGTVGINKDLDDHALPLSAWTAGRNIRFNDNKAEKFLGHELVFNPPAIPPYWAMPVLTADNVFWIYAGLTKVYAFQGGTHSNITRIKTSPEFEIPPSELTITTTAPSVAVAPV
ncbi:hypothetical protein LCGC14_0389560 [marine sediment metagenome]|uniref:Uncharacterized protein n=1 Tax=marine sediment metagenome TaxID=412755 RepID=A0A0F9T5R4_9ZZZZ